jgi:flagellar hook protein FlgE
MSLFGALSTAVSGLNGQSAAFSNISDNIANSQTVGFKGTNTAFLDYVTDSSATSNDSGSVQAIPLYQNTIQGSISQNDNPLSFAINGQGFFPVSEASSTTSGPTGTTTVFVNQAFYTRAGDFELNKNGYLVNSAGYYLNGWSVDAAGDPDRNAIAPIQVTQSTDQPVATSKVNLSANLPTYDDVTNPPAPVSSNVNVYDAQGASHTLSLGFTADASAPDTWDLAVTDANGNAIGAATVVFAADGSLTSMTPTTPSTGTAVTTAGGSADLDLNTFFATTAATTNPNNGTVPPNGSAAASADYQTINLNLGTIGGTSGVTEYAATTYTLNGVTQDGVPPGSFSSLTNQANGDIVANYDNGQSRVVARVPVVTFPAPDSLQRQNGSTYSATTEAGAPLAHDANTNGAGALEASSEEASNVDIGTEFTKLIVAQQAYSANAKLVTTADQMLQTTINMKQ